MFFHDIKVNNYKGYRDSAALALERGINVIVGRNSAGKTALLDALSLRFPASPHRSIITKPTPSHTLRQLSTADFTLTLTRDELIDLLIARRDDSEFRLPLPSTADPLWDELGLGQYDDPTASWFGEWFFAHGSFTFRLRREAYGGRGEGNWYALEDSYVSPRFKRATENDGSTCHYCKFTLDSFERGFSFHGIITSSGGRYYQDFSLQLGRYLHRYVYRFEAERLPSAPCLLGTNRTLASDASNLAEVLYLLQGNYHQFGEYNQLVREVMPEIRQVGTRRLDETMGEVVVWNDERAASRNDLAFSLQESGAGVGHVLAMMYVMLTAVEPQVIVIDEPQGYLHPGAARKLVEVLRRYSKSKHQLVIATHSPTVITSAAPDTITLVRQEGSESILEDVDITKVENQRKYLWAIGARLSDVFGYDRILWVEGETEEICFPMILRELAGWPLLGTAILRVQQTGDFDRRDPKNVIAIYERLSQLEGGLVPPVVGFVFDREDRSAKVLEDLKRQGRGRIHFISRRMYENYLLRPEAIAAVINKIGELGESQVTPEQVRRSIDAKRFDAKYFRKLSVPDKDDESWINNVKGTLLLKDLFSELSGGLVFYDKLDHSVMLTEWLIKNAPEDLHELSGLLVAVISRGLDRA